MSKIIYLAHYDLPNGERHTSPAGTAVMNYVLNSLEKINRSTTLISPALSKKELPREEITNGEHTKIILLPTTKKPRRFQLISRYLNQLRQKKALEAELLAQLEDGDTLMVYHSLVLMDVVSKIKKKKNIKLVLQICEIYADVLNNAAYKRKELDFFRMADSYVFQSEMLETLINVQKKPYAVLYGTYDVPAKQTALPGEGDIVRCVYAGTLDPRKGGAEAAVNACLYLPENYHLHILGFGSEKEVQEIKALVADISLKSKCSLSYDGCLSDPEYTQFLSSCQIGLCTQDPAAAFNTTSFPSKILSYMANGLRVVTVRIPAIEKSAVSKDVFYYDENSPANIAAAIKSIDFQNKYDGKATVKSLNLDFLEKLHELL